MATTTDAASPESPLEAFLRPLDVDLKRIIELTNDFTETFTQLAAHSLDQFLATPISESILRPAPGRDYGRYLYVPLGVTWLSVANIRQVSGNRHVNTPFPVCVLEVD